MEAAAQDRGLTSEWVQQFERSLDLDAALKNDSAYDGHLSLGSFARYYEIEVVDGLALVSAVYGPAPLTSGQRVHIGEPLPTIFDGGCGVITLRIEFETGRVISAQCNGEA